MRIGEKEITRTRDCYIVAEISGNHLGSFDRAKELIKAAAESGADAVKTQCYEADDMTINAEHIKLGDKKLWQIFKENETPYKWQPELKKEAHKLGLGFISTAYNVRGAKYLDETGVDAIKIASFELIDDELLYAVSDTGKPVILSTGMASWPEIGAAVRILKRACCGQYALLHCISSYPATTTKMNLCNITALGNLFPNTIIGLSDHTIEFSPSAIAVTLGARIIEKHLNLDEKGLEGNFAFNPFLFKAMVSNIRTTQKTIGSPCSGKTEEEKTAYKLRRSLYSARDIKKGTKLSRADICSIRPADGLDPGHLQYLIATGVAKTDIKKGTPLTWEIVEKQKSSDDKRWRAWDRLMAYDAPGLINNKWPENYGA